MSRTPVEIKEIEIKEVKSRNKSITADMEEIKTGDAAEIVYRFPQGVKGAFLAYIKGQKYVIKKDKSGGISKKRAFAGISCMERYGVRVPGSVLIKDTEDQEYIIMEYMSTTHPVLPLRVIEQYLAVKSCTDILRNSLTEQKFVRLLYDMGRIYGVDLKIGNFDRFPWPVSEKPSRTKDNFFMDQITYTAIGLDSDEDSRIHSGNTSIGKLVYEEVTEYKKNKKKYVKMMWQIELHDLKELRSIESVLIRNFQAGLDSVLD